MARWGYRSTRRGDGVPVGTKTRDKTSTARPPRSHSAPTVCGSPRRTGTLSRAARRLFRLRHARLVLLLAFKFCEEILPQLLRGCASDPPPPLSAPTPSSFSCPVSRNSILRNAYTSTDLQDRIFITPDISATLLGPRPRRRRRLPSMDVLGLFRAAGVHHNSTKPRGPRSATTCRQVRPS